MFAVKSVAEVIQIIDREFSGYPLDQEMVGLEEAVGRVTAQELTTSEAIPAFNRSEVDGYAVIAADTFGVSEASPVPLQLIGAVKMGEKPQLALRAGTTAYVPTGGELPRNAEAMVMIEETEDYQDGLIYIQHAAAPGNHVVFLGDDFRAGEAVIHANTRLRPQDVGALAALGHQEVLVKRQVKVGIIATGNEIVPVSETPVGSQVRDINSYALYAGLVNCGARPRLYGIVPDQLQQLQLVLEQALSDCDLVLISGGSSVGLQDETYRVINGLGTPGVLVHGIAVKPGKPTIIGKIGPKAVIGLPGHPASAYVIFDLLVRHLLDVINGLGPKLTPVIQAELACNYPSNHGREEFLPVRLEQVEGKCYAYPVLRKSGLISLLTEAAGYIQIRRGSEGVNQGTLVEVRLF